MKTIIFDYISFTFPMDLIEEQNERVRVMEYIEGFRQFFKIDDSQIQESSHALNNYRYQYILSDYITIRLAGPVDSYGCKTCQVELRGEGCREFERLRPDLTWKDFFMFMYGFTPDYKRIDVTVDDKSGKEIKLVDVFNKLRNGLYTSVFKSEPKYHGMIETGLTIDLGSRNSMLELCIYDKLKEQQSQGKKPEEEYWTRYEMRFRGDKANAVVLDLIKNYQNKDIPVYGIDLKTFAVKSLYSILDLKVNNDKPRDQQKKKETDPKWKAFLEDAEKGILPKANPRISTNETRFNYIMPKAKMILLQWLMECNFNVDLFIQKLLIEELNLLKNTTRSQLNRFNQYLIENGKTKMDFDGFNKLLVKIDDIIEERSLPF